MRRGSGRSLQRARTRMPTRAGARAGAVRLRHERTRAAIPQSRTYPAGTHAIQDLVLRYALELAPAGQLGPDVAVLADLVLELLGHDDAARPRLVRDAAREVDRRPEPVATARQPFARRDTGAQRRELHALGLDRVDQPEYGVEQCMRVC